MKYYEKRYENVFKRDLDKRCNVSKITLYKKNPESLEKYINIFRETFEKAEADIFDYIVKLEWLNRRFVYNQKRALKKKIINIPFLRARSLFIRNYVGFDPRLFFISSSPLLAVTRYIDDFFPDFVEKNPFEDEEEFKYPFKYVKMAYLILVGQMDERMELLKYAENRKMGLEEFKDYIVNYVSCYNEEHGPTYEYKFPSSYLNYVSVIKKREKIRTKGKKIKKKYLNGK